MTLIQNIVCKSDFFYFPVQEVNEESKELMKQALEEVSLSFYLFFCTYYVTELTCIMNGEGEDLKINFRNITLSVI